MELQYVPVIVLLFLVSKATTLMSKDSKDLYSEILGQTKYNLLLQNIAIPMKDSDGKTAKTYHPNPTDKISLWAGGDVPFMFDYGHEFTEEEKESIRKALKYISDNVPCLKFREFTGLETDEYKLIFSTNEYTYGYPYDYSWAYLGLVGSVDQCLPYKACGQIVHIYKDCTIMDIEEPEVATKVCNSDDIIDGNCRLAVDCFSFQTVVRLVAISLGVYQDQTENKRYATDETETNLSYILALATLYKEHLKDDSCMKEENIPKYFDLLEKQSFARKKYCKKGGYYLFLSDNHILQLPSFTYARCNIDPYPQGHVYLSYPNKIGLGGVVSAVVDDKLHVCGGGTWEGDASCHALHGTSWHGTPNLSVPRRNAESSMWQGGWLVTGGLMGTRNHGNKEHTTSELYKDGGWTAGPSLDEKTFWTRKPLMGVTGHCQVTAGGRVIVAGGEIPNGHATGATFSWDGSSWSQLGSMKRSRAHHACVEKDGVIYALGGVDYALDYVEKLNLATGVWSEGPRLPYVATCVQAVNIHGDIFVVGGEGSRGKIMKLVGNSWEFVSDYGFDGCGPISNPPILNANQVVCL